MGLGRAFRSWPTFQKVIESQLRNAHQGLLRSAFGFPPERFGTSRTYRPLGKDVRPRSLHRSKSRDWVSDRNNPPRARTSAISRLSTPMAHLTSSSGGLAQRSHTITSFCAGTSNRTREPSRCMIARTPILDQRSALRALTPGLSVSRPSERVEAWRVANHPPNAANRAPRRAHGRRGI
jgi:hypothetical protein